MALLPDYYHAYLDAFQIQLIQVTEAASVSCGAFCDGDLLVTGSSDNLVCLWRLQRGSNPPPAGGTRLKLAHVMRGHEKPVMSIAVSRPWSLVVSGSEDGSAIAWDLNRAQYVRSIYHKRPVSTCAIHQYTVSVTTSLTRIYIDMFADIPPGDRVISQRAQLTCSPSTLSMVNTLFLYVFPHTNTSHPSRSTNASTHLLELLPLDLITAPLCSGVGTQTKHRRVRRLSGNFQ